ncbi:WD40-repeat-containing domain protein [Naviculisporaceae sp. PSN 640]
MVDKVSSPTKRSAMLTNDLLSSPPRLPPKERRNPSITPRKFQKFFTPRSRVSATPSAARRALRDLAGPALNRGQTPSSPLKPISEENRFDDLLPSLQDGQRVSKRRKTQHTPERPAPPCHLPSPLATSPAILESSPSSRRRLRSPIETLPPLRTPSILDDGLSDDDEEEDELPTEPRDLVRPVPLARRGLGGQLLERMTNLSLTRDRTVMCPVSDWRTETASFYSNPEDVHECSSHEGAARSIPFCTTGCNRSSLVAVGDEEGYIRLLDSSKEFSKIHLSFQAHGNAIIDLAFSDDDYLLATASGDQTGRVIDMMTQTPISILGHHTASLKQVRFQPGRGSGAVLATSGRDGSVQIWDLRCNGGPVQEIAIRSEAGLHHRIQKTVKSGCVVNSIYDAHARPSKLTRAQQRAAGVSKGDVARIGEVPGRIGEVSVTSLQFLPEGREHLLLTGCEADASIKLWDIRSIHTSRQHKNSTPVSYTSAPSSHATWRPFGISSMALGGDGSRLYALCKDNTVYAYSTAHLILGHAPELTPALPGGDPPRRRHHNGTAHEGLGPIYGFRHPLFHATSFYIKAAIRPAAEGRSEMLAVGSSDGCAVLFPTDERYLKDMWARNGNDNNADASDESYLVGESTAIGNNGPGPTLRSSTQQQRTPTLVRSNSYNKNMNLFARHSSTIPIVKNGTPLVRGHEKEVGALTWTSEGKLVTVGDDYLVRCWSEEDRVRARDLRTGGEAEGRRWGCGWADVGDQWEGDVDDW